MDIPPLGAQAACTITTPFTDEDVETYAFMIAEVTTPVAYLPDLIRISKRTEYRTSPCVEHPFTSPTAQRCS